MRILLVEDEAPDMAALHSQVLQALPEAEISEARTFTDAERALEGETFDLVVLDLMLQGDRSAGMQLVKVVRALGDAAIIVVSGLDVETYRPVMFTSEVWDYLEKPVDQASLRLLVQRVAQQRRTPKQTSVVPPSVKDLVWNNPLENPRWKGHRISGLSLRERQVLWPLLANANQTVPYGELLDTSPNWAGSNDKLKAALSQMISKIRRQFEAVDSDFDCLQVIQTQGYCWRVARSD